MSQKQVQKQETSEQEICGAPTTKGGKCSNFAESCPWHDSEGNKLDTDAGRPSKLTPERQERMIEAAETGLPMTGIARAGGIDPSTLYEYMDKYEEFSNKLKEARNKAEMKLAKEAKKKDPRYILTRSFNWDKPSADTVINNNMSQKQSQGQKVLQRMQEAYKELEKKEEQQEEELNASA